MKKIHLLFLLLSVTHLGFSQIEPGEWREHLPYYQGRQVAEGNDKIYCSTEMGLFFYDKRDESVNKLTRIDGLSDVGINTIAYCKDIEALVVAYSNSNIDLILENRIYNIPDIKNKIMPGNKAINNITFVDKTAYLACGFGIVVIDLENYEIDDTYLIGNNGSKIDVQDVAFDGLSLLAATENGIYQADVNNPDLADFNNWMHWEHVPNKNGMYSDLAVFNNKIYALYKNQLNTQSDSIFVYDYNNWTVPEFLQEDRYNCLHENDSVLLVIRDYSMEAFTPDHERVFLVYNYPFSSDASDIRINHAVRDENQVYWIADEFHGLVKSTEYWNSESIIPNGPYKSSVFALEVEDNQLFVAGGGRDPSWTQIYSNAGIYHYENSQWNNINQRFNSEYYDYLFDITEIVIDPTNPNHVFAGSWGCGVIEILNGEMVQVFNDSNSTLQTIFPGTFVRVGGLAFDRYNNLWVTNAGVENIVSVYNAEDGWTGYPYGVYANANQSGKILVAQNGYKWMILPKGDGLFVIDDAGTIDDLSDDQKKKITVKDDEGEVVNDVYAIAEDKDGLIWLGTNQGVLVFYNPYSIFETSNIVAHRIIVELDGTPQHLLKTETVTAIEIDGANQKWLGTRSAGAFLMSEDATEQVAHFNTLTTPILSNTINAIAIDHDSGEIYFGTDKGISSYRGQATEGKDNFAGLYVFPNPVKPGFSGDIVISGTVTDANVKITDIAGNLVFETEALGGQAIWDGKDFSGRKVHTGVYLVFCTNTDGSKTDVTKLLFVK